MESGIKFLDVLEGDFRSLAEREATRKTTPPTRRTIRWKSWLAAAASLLVLAFAIGALAQLNTGGTAASSAAGPPALETRPGGDNHRALIGPSPAPGVAYGAAPPGATDQGVAAGKPTSSQGTADLTKIVRDGTVALSVPDGSFDSKRGQIVAIAHANGGFVLSSQTQGATNGTLTIRVPAARFDTAMAQVAKTGTVESSSVTGKDVTNQYIDYKAHLQNLIGRRTVLRSLLAQTTTIGESLTVENELEGVQLQIDQVQGELRYLNDQVEESTLTVDLHEESAPAGESETNGSIHNPSLSRAWDRAIQGFFGILATIIVGLGYLIPLVVIAAIAFGIVTLARRRGRAAS